MYSRSDPQPCSVTHPTKHSDLHVGVLCVCGRWRVQWTKRTVWMWDTIFRAAVFHGILFQDSQLQFGSVGKQSCSLNCARPVRGPMRFVCVFLCACMRVCCNCSITVSPSSRSTDVIQTHKHKSCVYHATVCVCVYSLMRALQMRSCCGSLLIVGTDFYFVFASPYWSLSARKALIPAERLIRHWYFIKVLTVPCFAKLKRGTCLFIKAAIDRKLVPADSGLLQVSVRFEMTQDEVEAMVHVRVCAHFVKCTYSTRRLISSVSKARRQLA